MANRLQDQINSLDAQFAEAAQTLRQELALAEERRRSLQHEIELLRAELAQVDEEFVRKQKDLDNLPQRFQSETVSTLVTGALSKTQHALIERLLIIRQRHEQLKQLRASIPGFEQLLEESRRFESSREQLKALPDSYQVSLLTHHQEIQQKLRPYTDLLEVETQSEVKSLRLLMVMICHEKDDEIVWVLPFSPAKDEAPAAIADLLDELWEQCIYVVLRLGQHKDWYFAGMSDEAGTWEGFLSVVTLLEYTGSQPVQAQVEATLQAEFDRLMSSEQSGVLQGCRIVVEVAAISQQAGELHLLPDGTRMVPPEPAIEPDAPIPSLSERSEGWYREEDVTAWERPLPEGEASVWSLQARRLRTALIGLLARGHMGSDYVEQKRLWQPLPSPHQEAMREGIARLHNSGILLVDFQSNVSDETLVSVNPDKIDRVQDLINRQVDDTWQEILAV